VAIAKEAALAHDGVHSRVRRLLASRPDGGGGNSSRRFDAYQRHHVGAPFPNSGADSCDGGSVYRGMLRPMGAYDGFGRRRIRCDMWSGVASGAGRGCHGAPASHARVYQAGMESGPMISLVILHSLLKRPGLALVRGRFLSYGCEDGQLSPGKIRNQPVPYDDHAESNEPGVLMSSATRFGGIAHHSGLKIAKAEGWQADVLTTDLTSNRSSGSMVWEW
jgi:hypothetical protein